jgi:hypothetical protein
MTTTILTALNLDFVERTIRTTCVLLLVLFAFGIYYFGIFDSLALLSGGIWSVINLGFLSTLVRAVVRPEGVNKLRAIGLAFIKFPLLYVAAYFLVTVTEFRPVLLVIGFSMVFVVIVLKAISRVVLHLDDETEAGEEHASGAV